MAQDISIAVIQTHLHWQDVKANLMMFEVKIRNVGDKSDIIVLPEMFTTGFSMEPDALAEQMNGPTMKWMAALATETSCVITGSLIIREDDKYFNRLIWMRPDKTYEIYDKKHLFAMAGEDKYYQRGTERLIVKYKGWRICPLICYDLRFPVWARNHEEYDILFYMANWPDKRAYDWKTLLRARAIENQCYVIGVNRIGIDNNGHKYKGDSCAIDPGWRHDLYTAENKEETGVVTLSYDHLLHVRDYLPFLQDQGEH